MFERFDERARCAVVWAQAEARALGRDRIGSEHILLGLVVEDARFGEANLAAQTLKSLDITEERVRASALQMVSAGDAPTDGRDAIPFSPEGQDALDRSRVESRRLGHDYVGPGHILLALVHNDKSVAARILLALGADPEKIWVTLRQLFLARRGRPQTSANPQSLPISVTASLPSFANGIQVAFSAQVRRVGMSAAARALDAGRSEIETSDLLVALTNDETSAPLLQNLGIDVPAVRDAIERQRRSEPPQASAED